MAGLLWTAKAVADAAGVSPRTLQRIAQRLTAQLDPPRYGRSGKHPRRHRLYTDHECALLMTAAQGFVKENLCPTDPRH